MGTLKLRHELGESAITSTGNRSTPASFLNSAPDDGAWVLGPLRVELSRRRGPGLLYR